MGKERGEESGCKREEEGEGGERRWRKGIKGRWGKKEEEEGRSENSPEPSAV